MLLNSLYTIEAADVKGEHLHALVRFNAGHEIFKGHFPELPVVPGVCQSQMLNEVLNYTMKKELVMKRAGQIKFLALLNPVETPELQMDIKITPDGGGLHVTASYTWQDKAFFRFKGEYQ